jgi:hypothetical protein
MDSPDLPTIFHQRLHLPDYDEKLGGLDPRKLDTGEADSPSRVWARERLRAGLDLRRIDKTPVDLLVWGKGSPPHPAGTKIGGLPVWPVGRPLPVEERNDWETPSQLHFFAQVNFADSLDILPELPGRMLSIWGTEDFPHGEDSVQTFWLDLDDLELAMEYSPAFSWDFMPQVPYFAALHRSWDRSRRQELLDEAMPLEAQNMDSSATSWMASKIGGQAAWIQGNTDVGDSHLFLQIKSIEPADRFPWAWVSEPQLLKIESLGKTFGNDRDGLNLVDGGAFYFFVNDWGAVETVFEFH